MRVSVLNPGGEDVVDRPEEDFPIPRTEYRRLYLDAKGGSLRSDQPAEEARAEYDSGQARQGRLQDAHERRRGDMRLHQRAPVGGGERRRRHGPVREAGEAPAVRPEVQVLAGTWDGHGGEGLPARVHARDRPREGIPGQPLLHDAEGPEARTGADRARRHPHLAHGAYVQEGRRAAPDGAGLQDQKDVDRPFQAEDGEGRASGGGVHLHARQQAEDVHHWRRPHVRGVWRRGRHGRHAP